MSVEPIAITASTTLGQVHVGTAVVMNAAAGLTVSLPPATGTGRVYTLVAGTTVTSNSYIIAANTTDIMQGAIGVATDAGGVVIPTAATSDVLTMNGSTTGGLKGSTAVFHDVESGVWSVSGALISTGTEATPFSAT